MSNLKENHDAAVKAARDLIEKSRSGVELSEDESTELKTMVEKAKRLGDQLKEAQHNESLLNSLGKPSEDYKSGAELVEAKSLGQYAVDGLKDSFSRIKGHTRVQSDLAEYIPGKKAAGSVTTVPTILGSTTQLLTPDVDRNIVHQYVQRPTIASWLGAGTIASNAITYFLEKVWDKTANGDFAMVAENAKKPGMTPPEYEEVTENLKKIAGWIKLSMEMAEDTDFLVSEINNRLLFQLLLFEEGQLLNGDGKGQNVHGLLHREGLQTATASGIDDNMDALFRANTAIFTKTGLRADGIVINPADYQELRLAKDENGQYYAGGPFSGQYGSQAGVLQDPPLWGLNTIQTTAIPKGTVLVGAGQQAATVYRKGGIRVEASNVDGEDFTYNRFTILAEERLTLAVRRPDAFVKLTLGGEPAPSAK